MSDDNMKLWNSVCETDPKVVKKFKGRGKKLTDSLNLLSPHPSLSMKAKKDQMRTNSEGVGAK